MPYKDPEKARQNAIERQRRYRKNHPERIKETLRKYNASEKGKLKHIRYRNNHPETCIKKAREWKVNNPEKYKEVYTKSNHSEKAKLRIDKYKKANPEKVKQSQKKYWRSEQGRRINRKKCNKRQRELGYNELFENILNESVEWHHINNVDVVAVPIDIHQLYPGKPVEVHRENMMYIVEQLYPDIKKEEERLDCI